MCLLLYLPLRSAISRSSPYALFSATNRTANMTLEAASPTLMGMPAEVRLRVYDHLFIGSEIKICSAKFTTRDHEIPGTKIKTTRHEPLPDQMTLTCRQIRRESLPLLLKSIKLTCCQQDFTTLDTRLSKMYRDNIQTVLLQKEVFTSHFDYWSLDLPFLPALKLLEVKLGFKLIVKELNTAKSNLTPEG